MRFWVCDSEESFFIEQLMNTALSDENLSILIVYQISNLEKHQMNGRIIN
jgi:hypothetical protein